MRLKRTGGSNPLLCATQTHPLTGAFFRAQRRALRKADLSEVTLTLFRRYAPYARAPSAPFYSFFHSPLGGVKLCQLAWQFPLLSLSKSANAPIDGCVFSYAEKSLKKRRFIRGDAYAIPSLRSLRASFLLFGVFSLLRMTNLCFTLLTHNGIAYWQN